jgi:hypothetical protein
MRGDLQHDHSLRDTLGVIFGFVVMTLFDKLFVSERPNRLRLQKVSGPPDIPTVKWVTVNLCGVNDFDAVAVDTLEKHHREWRARE